MVADNYDVMQRRRVGDNNNDDVMQRRLVAYNNNNDAMHRRQLADRWMTYAAEYSSYCWTETHFVRKVVRGLQSISCSIPVPLHCANMTNQIIKIKSKKDGKIISFI